MPLFVRIIKIFLLFFIFYFVCSLIFFCRSLYIFDELNILIKLYFLVLTSMILLNYFNIGAASIIGHAMDSGLLQVYAIECEHKEIRELRIFEILRHDVILLELYYPVKLKVRIKRKLKRLVKDFKKKNLENFKKFLKFSKFFFNYYFIKLSRIFKKYKYFLIVRLYSLFNKKYKIHIE